jgi:hypothetical protein
VVCSYLSEVLLKEFLFRVIVLVKNVRVVLGHHLVLSILVHVVVDLERTAVVLADCALSGGHVLAARVT